MIQAILFVSIFLFTAHASYSNCPAVADQVLGGSFGSKTGYFFEKSDQEIKLYRCSNNKKQYYVSVTEDKVSFLAQKSNSTIDIPINKDMNRAETVRIRDKSNKFHTFKKIPKAIFQIKGDSIYNTHPVDFSKNAPEEEIVFNVGNGEVLRVYDHTSKQFLFSVSYGPYIDKYESSVRVKVSNQLRPPVEQPSSSEKAALLSIVPNPKSEKNSETERVSKKPNRGLN